MSKTHYDITLLEDAVRGIIITGAVSSTVYKNRPKSGPQVNDFVVVEVMENVIDRRAFADTSIGVEFFSRDVNNLKNDKRLSVMYGKVLDCMPEQIDVKDSNQNVIASYLVDEPVVLPDAPDNFGFHARIMNFSLTLKNV